MRAVKMLAWEHVFVNKIRTCRAAELQSLSVRKYLDAFCVYLWAATGQVGLGLGIQWTVKGKIAIR